MNKGFTFFEIVISVAIVAILSSSVIFLINPPKLYAKARNAERSSELNSILNAIGENMAGNRGSFVCASGNLPTVSTKISSSTYDLAPCLVPTYLADMPIDPSASGAVWRSLADYDTGYFIMRNASSGRITVSAPSAELGQTVSASR